MAHHTPERSLMREVRETVAQTTQMMSSAKLVSQKTGYMLGTHLCVSGDIHSGRWDSGSDQTPVQSKHIRWAGKGVCVFHWYKTNSLT